MKTIQMTIDEGLLHQVDRTVQDLDTTRSAFIRAALEEALRRHDILKLAERDAAGYAKIPAQPDEAAEWESEQAWGDTWNEAK